jgi:GLPGLI family protein
MVNRIFILCMLIFYQLAGQAQKSYQVTYARDGIFYSTSGNKQMVLLRMGRQRLLINNNISFYYLLSDDRDPLKRKEMDSLLLNNSVYYDASIKKTLTLKVLPAEIGNLLVVDSIKDENWIFTNEKKKIKGYSCKAVFRLEGHDTTKVWFTEEIPLPFGPREFVGFPGLVVEVYSSALHFRFVATEIKEKLVSFDIPLLKRLSASEFKSQYE